MRKWGKKYSRAARRFILFIGQDTYYTPAWYRIT